MSVIYWHFKTLWMKNCSYTLNSTLRGLTSMRTSTSEDWLEAEVFVSDAPEGGSAEAWVNLLQIKGSAEELSISSSCRFLLLLLQLSIVSPWNSPVFTHTHTHTHAHSYTHTHMHTHTLLHAHTHSLSHAHSYKHTHTHTFVSVNCADFP